MMIVVKNKTSAGIMMTDGNLVVRANGIVVSTTLMKKGRLIVSSGGLANGTVIDSGGCMYISGSGKASSTLMVLSGNLYILRGGMINSTTVRYSELTVSQGGLAYNTQIESGGCAVMEGGMMSNTTVSGGSLTVNSGTATAVSIYSGGVASVSSGGSLLSTGIVSGSIYLESGGYASSVNISRGEMTVSSGGKAKTVNVYGNLHIYSGGVASGVKECGGYVNVENGASVTFAANTLSKMRLDSSATLHCGTTAKSCTVASSGTLDVYSGGSAEHTLINGCLNVYNGGIMSGTSVSGTGRNSFVQVYSGGLMEQTTLLQGTVKVQGLISSTVVSGGTLLLSDGGNAMDTIVKTGGTLYLSRGGIHSGSLQLEEGAVVSACDAVIDFNVAELRVPSTALINNWSRISGGNHTGYTITVNAGQSEGQYVLAGEASGFNSSITVKTADNTELGTISVGETLAIATKNYSLAVTNSMLTLTVSGNPFDLSGDSSGISWRGTAKSYTAEYTKDDYTHSLRITTSQTAVGTYGMDGCFDWQVCNGNSENWTQGPEITAVHAKNPQKLVSDADGTGDIFFGKSSGTWSANYRAQHLGAGEWQGTKEFAALAGKNQITDVFSGSTDANILVLTDDGNGDALFVDDIYSAFPGEKQARITQINEIRAGAGNDIVDLTSQRFAHTGNVTIRGGDGDDTLWANRGENKLFGDSGNDRLIGCFDNDVIVGGSGNDSMHGGGGNDIFCFCDNWGTDIVEQLAGSTVTLWFASQTGTWNQSTMTYSDGTNSVKVTGVSTVTLKYGDDGSVQYDELAAAGAFLAASSFNIFEEENKGIIAKLG